MGFIGEDISVFEIILFRALFGFGIGTNHPERRNDLREPAGLAVRAERLFGQYVFHRKELPVADITAIHFARPVLPPGRRRLLREALRGGRIFAIIAGVVGAAIIVRPAWR